MRLLAALGTSAAAQDEGRVGDPARQKTITATLSSCPKPCRKTAGKPWIGMNAPWLAA